MNNKPVQLLLLSLLLSTEISRAEDNLYSPIGFINSDFKKSSKDTSSVCFFQERFLL